MFDLRDKDSPLHVCVCGSMLWYVKCMFEDYQISTYMLDMECFSCGSVATAPTLIDMPDNYVKMEDRREEREDEEDYGD